MLNRGDLENFGKAEAWETLRSNRATRDRLDVDDLLIANHLAGLYEGHQIVADHAAFKHEPERMVALAGEGAPILSEYAASELSGHLRMPLQSARQLLGDAIEIAHRLPRLWQHMVDGKDRSLAGPGRRQGDAHTELRGRVVGGCAARACGAEA